MENTYYRPAEHKCGENRNHGKFKIYFLNILSDYRFKSCQNACISMHFHAYLCIHMWYALISAQTHALACVISEIIAY